MGKVLVVATSKKTRGGITTVVKSHMKGTQWRRWHCHWVQTHRDGAVWRKLAYFIAGAMDYALRLPFYEIVHIHMATPTSMKRKLLFFKLAQLLGKKTVVHFHFGSNLDELWSEGYAYIFSHADVSLFLSESIRDDVAKRLPAAGGALRVCYNACPDIESQGSSELRKRYILYAGTLIDRKGYADLIKAFALISADFPDWKLVLAGNGEVEKARSLSRELGIEEKVLLPGWVEGETKERLFREASVFCLPSYAEGFPMAVLEAWAYGLPVVTTPVGGLPDVAEDGENMLLFEPGRIEALSSQLWKMLSSEPLRQKIGECSRGLAQNQFNQTTINNQLDDLYSTLSSQK